MLIAVAGCVAQAEGKEIIRARRRVDLVVGSQNYHRLPEMIARARARRESRRHRISGRGQVRRAGARPRRDVIARRGITAFVTVQEGCDKFCTFCVVPYTRGAEIRGRSRRSSPRSERLAEAGVREITLIGQNVNAYHGARARTARLALDNCCAGSPKCPAYARLRYTTSHPRDMDDDLIAAHRELPALMPYVHLPVQSGSDRILAAMNRRHTRARLSRRHRPSARRAAGSCLYVRFHRRFSRRNGDRFPRYACADRQVGFAGAYSFKYSPRPGTPAAEMDDQIPQEEKSERLQRLQASIVRHQRAFNAGFFGQTLDVLLEKPGKLAGQLVGRSPHLLAVQVMAPAQFIGSVKRVTISKIGTNSLFGTLAQDESFIRPLATAGA